MGSKATFKREKQLFLFAYIVSLSLHLVGIQSVQLYKLDHAKGTTVGHTYIYKVSINLKSYAGDVNKFLCEQKE